MVAVAGDDDAAVRMHEPGKGGGRRAPVDGVGIAVGGHSTVLDQVAGEQHVGARHRDHDVVIGVASPEVAQSHLAPADLDGRRLLERPVGRVDDDLGKLADEFRCLGLDDRLARLAGAFHERAAADVPPDRRGSEDGIAVGMVEVPVRIDDHSHGVGRQRVQVGDDLARLAVRRARVDDERLATAYHDADVLVVERIAAHEDTVADLDPAILDAHRSMISSVLGSHHNRTPPPGSARALRVWLPPHTR